MMPQGLTEIFNTKPYNNMAGKSMDDELGEPLIEKEGDEPVYQQPQRRVLKLVTLFNFLILCLLPAMYYLGRRHGIKTFPKIPTHSITEEIYKPQLLHLDDAFEIKKSINAKYKGLPRPELDQAWTELVNHMNIRIHPDEAERADNFSSIELNDGSGDQMAMLTVFHSIHCLKTMREYVFPEAYPETWAKLKPPFPGGISPHMDHCIENLRQALMCQSDLSLYTYRWKEGQNEPEVITGMPHVCVDFEAVMDWVSKRTFSINDRLLQSPYQDGPWDPHPVKKKED